MKYLILLLLTTSLNVYSGIDIQTFQKDLFKYFQPYPSWWHEIEEDKVSFKNYKDLLKYWQSEKRCCKRSEIEESNKRFIKTVYFQLLKTNDEDILAFGASLLNISYHDHPNMPKIQKEIFWHLQDYDQPLDFCRNCKKKDLATNVLRKLIQTNNKEQSFLRVKSSAMSFLLRNKHTTSPYQALRVWKVIVKKAKESKTPEEAITISKMVLSMYRKTPPKTAIGVKLLNGFKDIVNGKNSPKKIKKITKSIPSPKPKENFNLTIDESVKINFTHKDIKDLKKKLGKTLSSGIKDGLQYIFYLLLGLIVIFIILYIFQSKTIDKKEKFFDDELGE